MAEDVLAVEFGRSRGWIDRLYWHRGHYPVALFELHPTCHYARHSNRRLQGTRYRIGARRLRALALCAYGECTVSTRNIAHSITQEYSFSVSMTIRFLLIDSV